MFYGDLIGPIDLADGAIVESDKDSAAVSDTVIATNDLAEGALVSSDKVSAAVSDTVIAANGLISDPVTYTSILPPLIL